MRAIASNLKGLYKQVILGPLFKLFEAVLELLVPLVMASIIDIGIAGGDTAYTWNRGLLLVLIAVLSVAAAITCQYFAAVASSRFGGRLRAQLFRHVLRFAGDETDAFGTGGLITRLTNDVNAIQTGLNMGIRLATRVPFLVIGSIVMALILNFRIGLVFLCSTPLVVAVLYWIMKRTVPSYTAVQKGQDKLSRLSRENLAGTRVIRAFSRQEQEQEAFTQAADELSRITIRVGRISAVLNPLTTLIINLAIMLIVWLGAGQAFHGTSEPGQIIALVTYMNQTLLALVVAANLVILFTRAIASLKRVAEVLDTQPSVVDGPGAVPDETAPILTFEDVSFRYHKGADDALENIGFTLRRGETLGIIGGTGSGKSTIVGLLVRYFDPSAGRVLVAGQDVRAYTLAELRGMLGTVPQNAALFMGSVRHNLRLGSPGADDETLWHALETAQAADFVRAMPDGLDSIIEEGGKNLSGGQRQRLTIARALVKAPQLLVLDDSTSALDYATDAALRRALRAETAAGADMSTVLIGQRAASIKHANHILVLDDGRVVGSGTHEELVSTNETYREICASQGITGGEVAG